MACYFFHIRNYGNDREDWTGTELPNLDSALAQAVVSARCVMSAALRDGRLLLAPWIDIALEDGEVLASLPFSNAIDTIYMSDENNVPPAIKNLVQASLGHGDGAVRAVACQNCHEEASRL